MAREKSIRTIFFEVKFDRGLELLESRIDDVALVNITQPIVRHADTVIVIEWIRRVNHTGLQNRIDVVGEALPGAQHVLLFLVLRTNQ